MIDIFHRRKAFLHWYTNEGMDEMEVCICYHLIIPIVSHSSTSSYSSPKPSRTCRILLLSINNTRMPRMSYHPFLPVSYHLPFLSSVEEEEGEYEEEGLVEGEE